MRLECIVPPLAWWWPTKNATPPHCRAGAKFSLHQAPEAGRSGRRPRPPLDFSPRQGLLRRRPRRLGNAEPSVPGTEDGRLRGRGLGSEPFTAIVDSHTAIQPLVHFDPGFGVADAVVAGHE